MLKQIITKIILVTILSIFSTIFLLYAWTEPNTPPPGGNIAAPINVSTSTQYKAGALGIGGALKVYSEAIFSRDLYVGGEIKSAYLGHTSQDPVFLCADQSGKIIKCPSSFYNVRVGLQGFGEIKSYPQGPNGGIDCYKWLDTGAIVKGTCSDYFQRNTRLMIIASALNDTGSKAKNTITFNKGRNSCDIKNSEGDSSSYQGFEEFRIECTVNEEIDIRFNFPNPVNRPVSPTDNNQQL